MTIIAWGRCAEVLNTVRGSVMADPATLIVQKQVEYTRAFSRTRSTTFASTVVNRFFSDNSLDRQRRVVECTKRRQAKALQKALEQERELEQLQQQYEHKQRLHELRNERENSRMKRRLHHVAAAFIQYEFRKYRHRVRRRLERERAARFVVDYVAFYWRRRCSKRLQATEIIQQRWRRHVEWKRRTASLLVLRRFLRSLIQAQHRRRQHAASLIQKAFRSWRWRRRLAASRCIQRAWCVFRIKKRIAAHARAFRSQRQLAAHSYCASILQRALGRFAVRQRLLRQPEFRRYTGLHTWMQRMRIGGNRPTEEMWLQRKRVLAEAAATSKRLQSEESVLLTQIQALQERAKEWQDKQSEEQDRLRRFHAWSELRRTKDDELLREQLRDWECRKRFEIRMELERELELERRLQLRSQQTVQPLKGAAGRLVALQHGGSKWTAVEDDVRVDGA